MPRSSASDSADPDAAAGRNAQIIPPAQFMADLADTIRIFCKVRDRMTIRQLAARAGIAEHRMEKLIHNDPLEAKQASGSELLSIWAVLRAEGASYGLAAIGMTAADDEGGEPDARLGLAVADLFDAGADLARAAADGQINADEAETVDQACDRAQDKIDELRRAGRRARRR